MYRDNSWCILRFYFQEALPVEQAIESNSPTFPESGKVALEEEGINQRIEEKGCLLMENNLNDSVSIFLNYQTEYSWFAYHDDEDHSLKWLLQIEFTVIILYFTREDNDTTRESRDLLNTTN